MLYHKEIFMPEKFKKIFHNLTLDLTYSRHAQRACTDDRNGMILPPRQVKIEANQIIEIETNNFGAAVKLVVRQPYDEENDLLIAMCPEIGVKEGFVKTCWLNQKNDGHATLKREVYATA